MDEIALLPETVTIFSILLMDYHPNKKKISLIQIQLKSLPLNLMIHSLSHPYVYCCSWLVVYIGCVTSIRFFHGIAYIWRNLSAKLIQSVINFHLDTVLCKLHWQFWITFQIWRSWSIGKQSGCFQPLNTIQHPGGRFSTPAIQRSSSSIGGNPFA